MNANRWAEYDAAAEWCARRGIAGRRGDRLPLLLDMNVVVEIDAHQEAFEARVRQFSA